MMTVNSQRVFSLSQRSQTVSAMTATFQYKMFERRNYELNVCYNYHDLPTTTIVEGRD